MSDQERPSEAKKPDTAAEHYRKAGIEAQKRLEQHHINKGHAIRARLKEIHGEAPSPEVES